MSRFQFGDVYNSENKLIISFSAVYASDIISYSSGFLKAADNTYDVFYAELHEDVYNIAGSICTDNRLSIISEDSKPVLYDIYNIENMSKEYLYIEANTDYYYSCSKSLGNRVCYMVWDLREATNKFVFYDDTTGVSSYSCNIENLPQDAQPSKPLACTANELNQFTAIYPAPYKIINKTDAAYAVMARYTKDGELLWTTTLKYPGHDTTRIIGVSERNGILYTTAYNSYNYNPDILFVFAHDISGQLLWQISAPLTDINFRRLCCPENTDKIYLCGYIKTLDTNNFWLKSLSEHGTVLGTDIWAEGASSALYEIRALDNDTLFVCGTTDKNNIYTAKILPSYLAVEDRSEPACSISPNPVSDFIKIQLKDKRLLIKSVMIVDILGNVYPVDTNSLQSGVFDVSNFMPGPYVVLVFAGSEILSEKIIIL